MLLLLALAFPSLLLGLMLTMEYVEAPLRRESIGDDLASFLDTARPDEIETFVSEGLAAALDRYWRRRDIRGKLARRQPSRA